MTALTLGQMLAIPIFAGSVFALCKMRVNASLVLTGVGAVVAVVVR